jgi:hypothetical protein
MHMLALIGATPEGKKELVEEPPSTQRGRWAR